MGINNRQTIVLPLVTIVLALVQYTLLHSSITQTCFILPKDHKCKVRLHMLRICSRNNHVKIIKLSYFNKLSYLLTITYCYLRPNIGLNMSNRRIRDTLWLKEWIIIFHFLYSQLSLIDFYAIDSLKTLLTRCWLIYRLSNNVTHRNHVYYISLLKIILTAHQELQI